MVKTICILAGQSGCSRAVVDPDLQIRGGGGGGAPPPRRKGGGGGHPDPETKGGSGLKNFVLIFFDWKA